MTVASQVKQTVASLKGVQATLDSFALLEKIPETKMLFEANSDRLNHIIEIIEQRVSELESQEPQYKGL